MKSIVFVVYICGFLVYCESSGPVKLPKGFLKCKQTDTEFHKCVIKGANLAVPELAKGQPKFGLPPIDPLRISYLTIDQGHGPVNIKLNFTDLDIHGLKSAAVKEMNVDFQKHEMQVQVVVKNPLRLLGQYGVLGKVLVLPINGQGPCNLTLYDFTAQSTTRFQPVDKNGEVFWSLKDLTFDFTVSKLHIYLANLFNGDKALGSQMNIFLNENWREILDELRPAFTSAFSEIFTTMVQRFFDKVPIVQVFPKQ